MLMRARTGARWECAVTETPKWQEVAGWLSEKIATGDLLPGADLPSEPEIMAEWGYSRDTVRRALRSLESQGRITAPGRGGVRWRVREHDRITVNLTRTETRKRAKERATAGADAWTADILELGRAPGQLPIKIEIDTPPAQVAEALGLAAGETALARHHVRTVDGIPHNATTTWYPMDIAQKLSRFLHPDDIPEGGIVYMLNNGIEQEDFPFSIETRMPDEEEARVLRIPPGVPVMIEHRVGITPEGRAVKCTVTTWPGDRVILTGRLKG
jgi:GntR family transcriptional regulator